MSIHHHIAVMLPRSCYAQENIATSLLFFVLLSQHWQFRRNFDTFQKYCDSPIVVQKISHA